MQTKFTKHILTNNHHKQTDPGTVVIELIAGRVATTWTRHFWTKQKASETMIE